MAAWPAVERLELFALHVPFREAVREAMARGEGGLGMAIPAEEPWTGGDFAVLRLTASDGSQGLGEAFVWLPETGVSPLQIADAIEHALAGYVLGADPFATGALRARMDANLARHEVAKGLVDMACVDLAARIAGRPVHDLLGGAVARRLPLAALVPLGPPDEMVTLAEAFQRGGTQSFRLKLGRGARADREIMAAVREALGPDVRLRADYNQAYTPDEAARAIQAVEPYGLDCAEQPVRADDWLGMARLQRAVQTPLMPHEGCFSFTDAVALLELGAIRVLGINTERPGGLSQAIRLIDLGASRGLGSVLHNQPLGIASAAQVHLGAARAHVLGHAMELFGHVMLEDDCVQEPLDIEDGHVHVPEGPGLGVTLDEGAAERYATRPPLVMER